MFRLLSNTLRWTQHDGHSVTMQTGHQVWTSGHMLSDALRWTQKAGQLWPCSLGIKSGRVGCMISSLMPFKLSAALRWIQDQEQRVPAYWTSSLEEQPSVALRRSKTNPGARTRCPCMLVIKSGRAGLQCMNEHTRSLAEIGCQTHAGTNKPINAHR